MKILILLVAITYNSYGDDFINEIHSGFDKFNENPILKINYYKEAPESSREAEARAQSEAEDRKAVALNKAEVKDGRYWVNGEWISTKYKPARNQNELRDSDNDGYDDYTEFVNGTDPNNNRSFPIIRNGNNKKIFK
jgi:hypothetical protein